MMRLLLCGVLILRLAAANAQELEDFQAVDGVALGAGVLLDLALRSIKTNPGAEKEIKGLDELALLNVSLKAKATSDRFLHTSLAGDVANIFIHGDLKSTWHLSLQSVILTDIINVAAKKLTQRKRPFTYHAELPDIPVDDKCRRYNKLEQDASYSFFSGHTAHVATFVFFTNSILWYTQPGFRSKDWIWISTSLIPAFVGYQRVMAGKHFPTDVLVGYLVGAGSAFLIPKLHQAEVDGKDLTEDFLMGLGTGLVSQYLFIKLLASRSKSKGCSHKKVNHGSLKMSPVLGSYAGLNLRWTF